MSSRSTFLAAVAALASTSAAQAATAVSTGSFDTGEIAVFEFTIGPGATYLDLTTNGSLDSGTAIGADTEIALYAGTGPGATRVGPEQGDDDDGIGLASTLSFGTGAGLILGDSFNLGGDGVANGEDGAVPAGTTFSLAIGEFATTFTSKLGDITNFGNEAVDYTLTIYSDAAITVAGGPAPVPLPATGVLLLGALGALGIRRTKQGG